MEAFISLISDGEVKDFPIPEDSLGRPIFIPQRGDQLAVEGKEYVVEGVKWYHHINLTGESEWVAAIFVHQIVH